MKDSEVNELIRPTVQALIDAFDNYQISDDSLLSEVDNFKTELINFAEANDNPATFFDAYQNSGIQDKYTALITKVAMAGQTEADASQEAIQTEDALPSVQEFLEQYRASYDEVCKRDSDAGRKAYEELFDVANQTDDLLEAQIIIEENRLNWKIVQDDAIEIFEKKLAEMDPLYLATTSTLLGQIKAYNESSCDEELVYHVDCEEINSIKVNSEFMAKMNLVANLSFLIISYIKAKQQVYEWRKDKLVKEGIVAMNNFKIKIQRLLNYMENSMNYSFDNLMQDEGIKIWMLNVQNIDEYGKNKRVMNPAVFEIFEDVIKNEILTDLSPAQALLR